MTDNNTDADDDKKVDGAEAGESDAEDNKTDDSDKSEDGQGKTGDDSKSDDSKSSDDDEEPRKRMSVKDHVIRRKAKSYDKIKSKEKSDDDSDDDDDDTAGLSDKARGAISKELDPVLDLVQRQEDERELQDVFNRFPDAKGMEKSIRKHMEAYPDAPVEFIYNALAGKRSRLNAMKTEADKEANESRTGGHTKRPKESSGGLKPADELSDEEFAKVVSKTMTNS